MTHTPPTEQQLDGYEAAARNAARIGSGIDPAAVLELAAEVRRLQAALAKEERLHGDTIDDRDRFHDMADKLAYAVAPEEVIGEHSSMNCPWENALDLITPMAGVDKLIRWHREDEAALKEMRATIEQLRAEVDAEKTAHLFTLRQRNNRSRRLAQLHDLAVAGDTVALLAAAKDTLAASVDDHRECGERATAPAAAETGE